MLFNSIEFFVFIFIFWLAFWFVFSKSSKQQNLLILVASYVFYGWWDYRFLSLLLFSSSADFLIGLWLEGTPSKKVRKVLLGISLTVNLGLLGFFKYFNFFVESFIGAFESIGVHLEGASLSIILPVGISFYTFQTLSYTLDIYNKRLTPTRDPIRFFAFVSFFPQLVAGPIERASNLLHQFKTVKKFNVQRVTVGIQQIIWGFAKKIIIADNCATLVNSVFENADNLPPSALWLGAVYFAFQIYGDFSGYSDIAIGLARVFGFDLMVNFRYPYFSRDIAEFWRRWHISLSTWFRDYLYIPLGGSKGSVWLRIRNTVIVFLVSGLWHGANWTFVVWGAINAVFIVPLIVGKRNRVNLDTVGGTSWLPSLREIVNMLATFTITCIAWVFFRSEDIISALQYVKGMVYTSGGSDPSPSLHMLVPIAILLIIEWIHRHDKFPEFKWLRYSWIKVGFYLVLVYLIVIMSKAAQDFIYFQF